MSMFVGSPMPLADITNSKALQANKLSGSCVESPVAKQSTFSQSVMSPQGLSPSMPMQPATYTHDPYGWKCLPEESQIAPIMAQRSFLEMERQARRQRPAPQEHFLKDVVVPAVASPVAPTGPQLSVCKALVQFKCHQTEFASPLLVDKGQYVVVQGDRGIDIGVVIRVNTDGAKAYVERTGPSGTIIRHATQREVDFWATDLKADEATALEYCQDRVGKLRLPMEVKYAEFQFDKKKLTFYYEAKTRVDFVNMLKELYREFGCRIWMEKVRLNQLAQE